MRVGYFELSEQTTWDIFTPLFFCLCPSPTSLFLAEYIFIRPVWNMHSKTKTKLIWEESELLPLMKFFKFLTTCKLHSFVFPYYNCKWFWTNFVQINDIFYIFCIKIHLIFISPVLSASFYFIFKSLHIFFPPLNRGIV